MNSPENIFERQARKDSERYAKRRNLKQMIESMIVELRPDYDEAEEIVGALKVGMEGKLGEELPLEVEYAIFDLKKSMDAAYKASYEPEAFDSIGEDRE